MNYQQRHRARVVNAQDDPWTEDDDALGSGTWNAAKQARIYLANLPAERRAQLEREWEGEPQVRSCSGSIEQEQR